MSEHATPLESFLEDGKLTANAWARALREHVLLGQECDECGHKTAAPKGACARCGNRDIRVVRLSQTGRVYSETTIAVPPEGFSGPYTIALISLDDDARILAQVPDTVEIGDEVSLAGYIEDDPKNLPSPVFE